MSDHELVIYEDGEVALECHAKGKDPVDPPCWYTDTGENMGGCNAVLWAENDGLNLYDAIRVPVIVEWRDGESGALLAASGEPEDPQSHNLVTLRNQDTRLDVLMCVCGLGPFADYELWATHRYHAAEEAADALRIQLRRVTNELALYEVCDLAHEGHGEAGDGMASHAHEGRTVWHKAGQ